MQFEPALVGVGVAVDALIRAVEERSGARRLDALKQPRVLGAARAGLLASQLEGQDLSDLLQAEERGSVVERKRTVLNKVSPALADQEQAAVALVNGSPEQMVFMIFGQDDNLTIQGEVDHRADPMRPEAVQACQRRLVDRLQKCVPPIPLQWVKVENEGKIVWIAGMLGRARGTAVMTSGGSYPYRSGEDTFFARPEMIVAWLREPLDRDAPPEPPDDVEPPGSSGPEGPITGGGQDSRLEYQRALTTLDQAVTDFFQSPPDIPHQISGRSLDDWQPVYGPILERFRPAIESVVGYGRRADEEGLNRLARGIRSTFRLKEPRGGLSWITEAPRLVARLISDQLLTDGYCTHQWHRLVLVGQPPYDSSAGRMPWVLTPEYRHPETLGHDALLAAQLSLQELDSVSGYLRDQGVSETRIRTAYSAVSIGLGLSAMARQVVRSRFQGQAPWIAFDISFWDEVEEWEAEAGILAAFAELGGEGVDAFRSALPGRVEAMLSAQQASGRHLYIPKEGWEGIQRLSGR
jgi:hypothetical protein